MQIGARRKCRRAGNIVQNNADNASNDACTKPNRHFCKNQIFKNCFK